MVSLCCSGNRKQEERNLFVHPVSNFFESLKCFIFQHNTLIFSLLSFPVKEEGFCCGFTLWLYQRELTKSFPVLNYLHLKTNNNTEAQGWRCKKNPKQTLKCWASTIWTYTRNHVKHFLLLLAFFLSRWRCDVILWLLGPPPPPQRDAKNSPRAICLNSTGAVIAKKLHVASIKLSLPF